VKCINKRWFYNIYSYPLRRRRHHAPGICQTIRRPPHPSHPPTWCPVVWGDPRPHSGPRWATLSSDRNSRWAGLKDCASSTVRTAAAVVVDGQAHLNTKKGRRGYVICGASPRRVRLEFATPQAPPQTRSLLIRFSTLIVVGDMVKSFKGGSMMVLFRSTLDRNS
jgi:hypothetical protein